MGHSQTACKSPSQNLFETYKGGCVYIISDRHQKRKVVIMDKHERLKRIDDGILQVKQLQRDVEQNTIIEEKAIQLISECRFKEAIELLNGG